MVKKRVLLIMKVMLIIYLLFPLLAGAFDIGYASGPKIYNKDYHITLYRISYQIVYGEKARVPFDHERPLFYSFF